MKYTRPERDSALDVTVIAAGLAPYRITLLNKLAEISRIRLSALLSHRDWRFQRHSVGLERARFPYQVFKSYSIQFYTPRADHTGLGISPRLWGEIDTGAI